MGKPSKRGVVAALAAAALFGAGAPAAKSLLQLSDPWLLAGLLYAGSGLGLLLVRLAWRMPHAHLAPGDGPWLAGAIVAGGLVGPVLLMAGLANMPASAAALLLNAEGVFTALIAWFVFRENFDRRIALGMALIVAGAVTLSWPGDASLADAWPALAILGACLAWGIDNNLTRKVALADATFIAMAKGLAAGFANVAIAFALGARLPGASVVGAAAALGFASYGLSLVLFVVALRELGTARTGAYFSTAPFVGAILSLAWLGEPASAQLAIAGALMAAGVWLHLTERHQHDHVHVPLVHEHDHEHDEHHAHAHDFPVSPGERHSHVHAHEGLRHSHAHFPDAHHRHAHDLPEGREHRHDGGGHHAG
jgi:drug/metabolite transporter (DMT)-like permease